MDDSKRFLRFVTPGLVFVLELALFLWLGLSDAEKERWKNLLYGPTRSLNGQGKAEATVKGQDSQPTPSVGESASGSLEKILTAVFTVVVASGGIGFLLSMVHHTFVGSLYHFLGLGFRYKQVLETLQNKGKLK